MSLEDLNDFTDFIIAAQPNGSSFMNTLGNLLQYSSLAVESETPGFLDEFGHGETFVEETKFSARGFLVRGVSKDSAVQQSTMDIGDHGPNVPKRVN